MELYIRLILFFDNYKSIFVVCGVCLLVTLLSYVNETSWGVIITMLCWGVSIVVCSAGIVCLVNLIKNDIQESERQMAKSIQEADYYKEIKATNDLLQEELGVGIADMLLHPDEVVQKTTAQTSRLLEGLKDE